MTYAYWQDGSYGWSAYGWRLDFKGGGMVLSRAYGSWLEAEAALDDWLADDGLVANNDGTVSRA